MQPNSKPNVKMIKRLNFIVLTFFACLLFASCSRPSLIGTWIEPVSDEGITGEIGFTLLENGEVIPINMGFAEVQSWEKSGDMIYFKGSYTGTNPHDFVDTMKIVKVDETQLVLEQAGYTVTYQRK